MNGKKELELYIHIPFCVKKCLYCDFLSFPAASRVQAEYMDQLRCEILFSGPWYEDYRVKTIFIGGGTPSSLEPEQITMLMQTVRRVFHVEEGAEITLEANPGTRLGGKLAAYRQAGINRLSLGLQSANNDELKHLGRIHTFEDFLLSFQAARMAGFSNINVDLMSAIPGQSAESWRNTVRKVIMLKPEHISAYSLIVEEGTPFGDHYLPEGSQKADGKKKRERQKEEGIQIKDLSDPLSAWPPLADEEEERQMYRLTKTFLEEAGYRRYEISNYSRPGKECRHNIGYWTGAEYLGLGLGASSYVDGRRFSNEPDLNAYQSLDFSLDGLERLHGEIHVQSRKEQMEEFMFLGLRMMEGVSAAVFAEKFGIPMEQVYGPVMEHMVQNGLLVIKDGRAALTEWGIDVSNYVMSSFLLD